MTFVDKSTLTCPATNSFPIRKFLNATRAPTTNDFRDFQIFDIWIWINQGAWIMIDRTTTFGTWQKMGATGTGILSITGTSGGAVGPDGANNINLGGGTNVTVAGNPGANTLTINLGGAVATSFPTDAGTAIPSAGALTIHGANGITTSGAGSTVTISAAATVPLTFHTDGADATPAANAITIAGAGGITTSGAGSTVTITAGATIPTTFTGNTGSATPAANNLNVIGAVGITVSGAGSTLTITGSGGGLTWNVITVVGPTAMAVNNGYVTDNASPVQLLLPATASVGSTIKILGRGTGGWLITQNAGQSIVQGALTSTVGAGGTVGSSEAHCCVEVICMTANTLWMIADSTGNLIVT